MERKIDGLIYYRRRLHQKFMITTALFANDMYCCCGHCAAAAIMEGPKNNPIRSNHSKNQFIHPSLDSVKRDNNDPTRSNNTTKQMRYRHYLQYVTKPV